MSQYKTKFVKAYCSKTKDYYGLEVREIDGEMKVTNFTPLNKDKAKLAASEVDQDHFETAPNLLACQGCGTREVASCNCGERKGRCQPGMPYRFQCLYCHNLVIDHSLPKRSDFGLQAGKTVMLEQGQEVAIRFADERPLNRILVGVGWDPSYQDENTDVDSSVVVASSNGGYELVYFGELEHESGCVKHHGDNLTGEDEGGQADDENIDVYLNKVPASRDRLIFILNIYKAEERDQHLSGIRNLYIRLIDPTSRTTLIQYKVNNLQLNNHDNAFIIGMAIRRGDSFAFKALGIPCTADSVQDLADKAYGMRF